MGSNSVQHARKEQWVYDAFDITPPRAGMKTEIGACRHCKDSKDPPPFIRTWNTSEMKIHLQKCDQYTKWKESEMDKRAKGLPDEKKQKKLVFQPAGAQAFSKDKLDKLFGMAIYTSYSSFR
jgi:hypothetical protein